MTVDTHPTMDMDVERRLGGVGPFVINLHASTAPIDVPAKSPAGSEQARLYRIQRVDDGRVRYRLRLGPFATEDEAEAVLAKVRLEYPCALLLTAAADDLHAIALVRGKTAAGGSSADARNSDTVLQPVLDTRQFTLPITAVPVTPAALPAAAAPVPALTLTLVEELTLVDDAPVSAVAPVPVLVAAVPKPTPTPAAVIAASAATTAAPVRALAPVVAQPAPAAVVVAPVVAQTAPAAAAPQRAAVSVASDLTSMQALIAAIDTDATPKNMTARPALHAVPAAKASSRSSDAPAGTPAPSLESTQTLRPLTPLELGEHEATRWFVVQLATSEDAFDPDALPHLDIFSLYRLYTVIGMDQGRLVHALRLGFFGEEVGARAVANYLAAYYDEPLVKRVSVAERDRFADQRVEARKDVGATGRHLAIEITDELVVRGRRSSR